jgi:hypothetical protein
MPVVITGNNTPTAGGVVYGDGTTYATTTAGTSGRPIVSGGSGAPTFRPYTLPAADGSANQILQTDGAGALSFATPSTGALVFISSQTVSTTVSSIDFTSGISSTYDDYQIIFENMTASSVNGNIRFFLYQSGSFSTSYSTATLTGISGSATSAINTAFGQIQGTSPADATSSTTWRGNVLLQNVNSSSARGVSVMGTVAGLGTSTGEAAIQIISGASNTAAVVTGFRIAFSSVNIVTGTVRLYGIAKS